MGKNDDKLEKLQIAKLEREEKTADAIRKDANEQNARIHAGDSKLQEAKNRYEKPENSGSWQGE